MKKQIYSLVSFLSLLVITALMACGGTPTAEPTVARPTRAHTAVPTQAQVVPTQAPPSNAQNDDLKNVQAKNKLVIGTSADYAPFAFYASDNSLDGFDIAVMREIAKRMGIAVEVQDYAFDGLLDALKLGQIDGAIAALSITPARQLAADFSVPYYLGEDAALARSDADFEIHSASDTIGRKIGVQRGTVFESWIAEANLNAGITSPDANFVAYENANDMLQGLRGKQVDVIILGAQPALQAAQSGELKLVGQAMNAQQYGIATRKSSSLNTEFNRVLLAMYQDGTLQKLMQQYLNLDSQEALPLPEIAPQPATPVAAQPVPVTATPRAGQTCVLGMSYLGDVNLDDKNMQAPAVMQPGQAFNKVWRIQNSGTCDWQPDFALTFVRGNVAGAEMGGSRVPLGSVVKPGETLDVRADLIAPQASGTYQGFWQMRSNTNAGFGKTMWVGITVPGAQALPTLVPNLRLRADAPQVYRGQCTVIRWDADNASAVGFVEGNNTQGVNAHDARTVCPQATTTYRIRATLSNNQTIESMITIAVLDVVPTPQPTAVPPKPNANRPRIQSFTVNENKIKNGACVNLQWATKNTSVGVTLQRDGVTILEMGPANGTQQDCPSGKGLYTYTLIAAGENIGSQVVQQSLTVQVTK